VLRRFSLLIAAVLLLAPPAGAQSRDEAGARLVSFSGWAAPDRPLAIAIEVTNSGSTPLEDVAVRLTIKERVRSRSGLRASLDGNPTGQTIALTTEQFDQTIQPQSKVTIPVERDLGSLANAFRPGRAINAVYPLGVAVLAGGRTVAQLSGAFVFLGVTPQAPLNLVWVMPIHRPYAADARGVFPRTPIERELSPSGRLRALADLLTAHAGAALTLAPTGAFADQLLDLSNGFRAVESGRTEEVAGTDPLALAANDLLARYRAAIASPAFEVATTPYARASIPSLVGGGLTVDAGRQVAAGRNRVTTVLGRAPDPSLFVDGSYRADVRSARAFASFGAKTMILDPAVLRTPVEARFGPERVSDVRASSLSFNGLFVDAPIRQRLELASQDPVLTAMGVVAETAAAFLELPALAAGRMVVIATASTPDPAVTSPLLDVLTQAPWLKLRTASDAAAEPALQPTGDTSRFVATPPVPATRFAQARAARRFVDVLRRVVVAPDGADELDRLERLIYVSESADYDARLSTGASLSRAARERAQRRLGQITVPPRRVTLTSRGGQVPVTVVNATGYHIRVQVRLDSQKVTFPTGATRRISIPGKERGSILGTLAFALEAKAAGSFPLTVRVETYDGKDLVGTGQILVRSSAVSAVTFMATAGGALFLAVAWARRALTRRAKRDTAA
jgi:uncharacterized protein DUF6049